MSFCIIPCTNVRVEINLEIFLLLHHKWFSYLLDPQMSLVERYTRMNQIILSFLSISVL